MGKQKKFPNGRLVRELFILYLLLRDSIISGILILLTKKEIRNKKKKTKKNKQSACVSIVH